MIEKKFVSTKEVAVFLGVNEKMVYTLVSEKGLPATKVTGKWMFPIKLVEQWMENRIINHPGSVEQPSSNGIIVFVGSHDILLEKALGLFNRRYPGRLAVFGNVGSQGGLEALARGLCHMAASHLLQQDEEEYNFDFVAETIQGEPPAVVNFCRREQGLLLARGNPRGIQAIADLGRPGIKIVNRPPGTGTRLLFDLELDKAGIKGPDLEGYDREYGSHLDVGIKVLTGRADTGLAIRSVADLLGLDFIPIRWERFDLLVSKNRFFDKGVQIFLGFLQEASFRELAEKLSGYDLSLCGRILYSRD